MLSLLLAGCGSSPEKRGGFYQNDGPPAAGSRSQAEIARTPDAVPRVEPFHPYANRPYTALGRSYTPMTSDRPLRQRGLASWYGRQFHGARTSSGEIYDMFAMTAAHTTMPLPSYARVTNTRTGAAVIVRVNDRGPFKSDRVIDLSYAAAVKLGIAASGTGEVEVERITHREIAEGSGAGSATAAAGQASPEAGGTWAVQFGAFSAAANAEALRTDLAAQLSSRGDVDAAERSLRIEQDGPLHRVLIGALPSRAEALALSQRLERLLARETSLWLKDAR